MSTYTRLKPDRSLLDPNFEGYKLSLSPLPIYKYEIKEGVSQAVQNESQFALQHFRIFGLHNHLYADPWHEDYLYFVVDRRVVNQIKFNQFGFEESRVVLTLPGECQLIGQYNESIHFTSPHQVIVADGCGSLHLIMTDDRTTSNSWKIVFSGSIDEESKPFVVVYSKLTNHLEIECLLLSSEEKQDIKTGDNSSPFLAVLTWITLSSHADGSWSVTHKRRLVGVGPVEYASLQENAVVIVSAHPFKFSYDSKKPIELKKETPGPLYAWSQDNHTIQVVFKVSTSDKNDVDLNLTPTSLQISVKDEALDIDEEFFAQIDVDDSSWTIVNNTLKLSLTKSEPEYEWQKLLKNDDRGERVNDITEFSQMERLMHSVTREPVLNEPKPAFDPNQLEECDAFPSDLFKLSIFNGDSHDISCEINLSGHQWLFTICLSPEEVPAFCIRHDVDGIVWQPTENNSFEHKLTINAFGYVQASKQDRKFSTCSPDGSFAVISEIRRHLYIYHRPAALASQIRNRRTGKEIAAVARQQVVNLDVADDVIGIQATRQNIFVLTKQNLFAIRVLSGSET